ncbi:MAG: P-type conjugative transfer protein TrbG [Methylococcaceae bacterium]|nr:P-type conjugative transfer protein TrbG [Methylococcaceae bacterium]
MNNYLLVTLSAFMLGTGQASADKDMAEMYFSDKNPTLSKQERRALAIANKWKGHNSIGMAPSPGKNGAVSYLFGAQQPSVVCAVLQVCDVALQAGEQVNSINLGDTARWTIEPAITGSGENEVQHIIIKPMDVGLETSLVVTTNRRTYHLRLRSHRKEYMPQVVFTYPDEEQTKWNALRKQAAKKRQDKTIAKTGEYLGNLDFAYEIEANGSISWTPVRVFNDKQKTIIEMPDAMAQTEAPTLLVVRREGGLFEDDETVQVNYRIQGNRYIVDSVFDSAILIAGIGNNQDSVTIKRVKP